MNVELFTPYSKQKEFIDNYVNSDKLFGVVVAPRGTGKTLLAINVLLYWLLNQKNQKGGWISPVYSQAKSVYDQIVKSANELIIQQSRQDLIITFQNGSTIKFLSTDNADSIRGFRFTHLILDETAFMKPLAIDQVILPTLNPNGKKCLMISTPKGKNHFYEWYQKANEKESNVFSFKITLPDCPYVKQELIDEAKASLPLELYKQEFLGEFTDITSDVFTGIDNVCIIGTFDRQRRQEVFAGVDTGLTNDSSVLTIMNETGRILWIEEMTGANINTIASVFKDILSDFEVVSGFVETNGVGQAMYHLLYPSFRKLQKYTMTQNGKVELVRKLISDINTNNVMLPTKELCPELYQQLSDFTYKVTPSGAVTFGHPTGGHDDFVISLMLANASRVSHFTTNKLNVRRQQPKNTRASFGSLPV